jgi:hypothetical protein
MATEAIVDAPPAEAAPAPAKPKAPKKDAAAAKGSAGKKEKGKKDEGKDRKGKKSKDAQPAGDGPSVAGHPRAARAVALAKGWGGLVGFVLGGYMSLPTNTLAAAGLRALIAGIVCYVAVWAGAVFLWRRLVMLELKGREQQMIAASLPPSNGPGARPTPAKAPERARARAAS